MTKPLEPHLAATHEQFPDGFPARLNDDLLGHWPTPGGVVVVEPHPHGYELHFYPCYRFALCEACAPDRGPSNPHTSDGHHFRACPHRGGPILTVAGGDVGQRAVLEYLSREGSEPHARLFAALVADEAASEAARLAREQAEGAALQAEEETYGPSDEERLAAVEAELAYLREKLGSKGEPVAD